jgi:hypothetical protein
LEARCPQPIGESKIGAVVDPFPLEARCPQLVGESKIGAVVVDSFNVGLVK